ncbi:tyrosine-type recombinase/integrase [Streptomyces sp. TRM76130]|nr:tyrosine-type recombinase/integrase [Streptomyces sp. TRM76130]
MTRTGYLYASYFYPKIWMVALDKGGVSYCKAHSLRHYYGPRLLYAGVPGNDVADWMGHSSTDVLREHYHYVFEGAEQRGGRAAIARPCSRPARTTPRRRRRQTSPDPHTTTAPGITLGAVLLVLLSGRFEVVSSPDFPQHEAHEQP